MCLNKLKKIKKPELIPQWKQVLIHAWSVRFLALAGLLSGAEIVLPLFVDSVPRNVFVGLVVFTSMAGLVARVVSQKRFKEE